MKTRFLALLALVLVLPACGVSFPGRDGFWDGDVDVVDNGTDVTAGTDVAVDVDASDGSDAIADVPDILAADADVGTDAVADVDTGTDAANDTDATVDAGCKTAATCPAATTACHVAVCNADGSCGIGNAVDTTSCDDGDACTTGDGCALGLCVGAKKNCDDANACTDDSCDSKTGKCLHTNRKTGDPCTISQSTAAGVCLDQGDGFKCWEKGVYDQSAFDGAVFQ